MATPPTFNQIRAKAAAIKKSHPSARTIAIRAQDRWTGEPHRSVDGETYLIRQCDSPLAMRLALRDQHESDTQILITHLDDRQVGDDILVRLTPRRVESLDSWQIVKSLFQARTIDPRLRRLSWMADALLEASPTGGFTPVAGGFLDAETAWSILLSEKIGLEPTSPDLLSILTWSTRGELVAKLRQCSAEFHAAALEWIESTAGKAASVVLDCAAQRADCDAVPIGLAAGVVFHPQAGSDLQRAVGHLEARFFGGRQLPPDVLQSWAIAATDIVRTGLSDPSLKVLLVRRADEILHEVGAVSHAWRSDTSPAGFDQRLAQFGEELSDALTSKDVCLSDSLHAAITAVRQHDLRTTERRRLERADMAMRLLRWLQGCGHDSAPRSLAQAAKAYLSEGGYVDWARLELRGGDSIRELSEAYAKLFDRVSGECEKRAEVFGRMLADWTASTTTDPFLVPVEEVLDRIVAPIAQLAPVLVVVIDGMSVAVFRELMDDLLGHEWLLYAEDGVGLRPGLATIPSLTEVSRTSLLSGERLQGNADIERRRFAANTSLLQHCRAGFPPVLFHKASLQVSEDAKLAAEIRDEISSTHRRIVGVVINAVDDNLAKGDQISLQWNREAIRVLPALLQEAKMARRAVILLSDHGHVLESNMKHRPHDAGERWRPDEGAVEQDEVRIRGSRVVIPESHSLIAPWSERVRYKPKKHGYHGGVSPQEMVVPIGVLSTSDRPLPGWGEAPVDLPAWWEEPLEVVATGTAEVELRTQPPASRETLFDLEEVSETPASTPAPPVAPTSSAGANTPSSVTVPPWVTALVAGPVFAAQRRMGGRAVPGDEVFVQLLATLDHRGGKMTSAALARAMNYPAGRMRGLLAVTMRVLNIEGFQVLSRDDASDTIELNRQLLLTQFDLI